MTPESEREIRKLANKKAREEIRNAVRHTMVESGIAPAQIKKTAAEMAAAALNDAVKKATGGPAFEALIQKLVKEELNKILKASGMLGGLADIVKKLLIESVSKAANDFVEANVVLKVKEGDWT